MALIKITSAALAKLLGRFKTAKNGAYLDGYYVNNAINPTYSNNTPQPTVDGLNYVTYDNGASTITAYKFIGVLQNGQPVIVYSNDSVLGVDSQISYETSPGTLVSGFPPGVTEFSIGANVFKQNPTQPTKIYQIYPVNCYWGGGWWGGYYDPCE